MIVKNSTQQLGEWSSKENPTELNIDLYSNAIVENSILHGISRKLKTIFEKDQDILREIAESEIHTDLSNVKKIYGFKDNSYFSKKTQRWIGHVIKIEGKKFFAHLDDITNSGTNEVGEFDTSEVSPGDLELLEKGAIFYWSIGDTIINGQLKKESLIRFKRSINLSTVEVDRIKDRADDLLKKISWE